MIQRHDLAGGPLLDSKVLDVDVTSLFGVGEVGAGCVVTVDLGSVLSLNLAFLFILTFAQAAWFMSCALGALMHGAHV